MGFHRALVEAAVEPPAGTNLHSLFSHHPWEMHGYGSPAQLEREDGTFGSQVHWRNSAEAHGCEHPKSFLPPEEKWLRQPRRSFPQRLTCAGHRPTHLSRLCRTQPMESPAASAGDSQVLSHCVKRAQVGQGYVEPIHQREGKGGSGSSEESSLLALKGGHCPQLLLDSCGAAEPIPSCTGKGDWGGGGRGGGRSQGKRDVSLSKPCRV